MNFTVEVEQEEDGRWLEVAELPGALAYGQTREEAIARVQASALRVVADRLEHGEPVPQMAAVFSVIIGGRTRSGVCSSSPRSCLDPTVFLSYTYREALSVSLIPTMWYGRLARQVVGA